MELMRNFHEIARLGYPSMVAVSRKSYIGKAYGIEDLTIAIARRRPRRSWRASWAQVWCAPITWRKP